MQRQAVMGRFVRYKGVEEPAWVGIQNWAGAQTLQIHFTSLQRHLLDYTFSKKSSSSSMLDGASTYTRQTSDMTSLLCSE